MYVEEKMLDSHSMKGFKYGQDGIIPLAIVFFQGQYHLFFSSNSAKGVFLAKSLDLYEFNEVHLFLSERVKGMCSAVVKNEKIFFFYSCKQNKLRLITLDGRGNSEKYPLPIISGKGLKDPKVFHDGERYYLIGCTEKGFSIYSSENLLNYDFCVAQKCPSSKYCCPSLHKMGDDWFLIFSDINGVYSQKAQFDGKTNHFELFGEVEKIDDIKTPRISHLSDGRTIMTGTFYGCFLIREVWGKNGKLMLLPVSDINQHKKPCSDLVINNGFMQEEIIDIDIPFFAQITLNEYKLNDFICNFSVSTVYPEYIHLNFRENNISICSGRPKGVISSRNCLLQVNLQEIEIYFYENILEVFIKSSGAVLVSLNPFKEICSKKIIINNAEGAEIKVSLARIE